VENTAQACIMHTLSIVSLLFFVPARQRRSVSVDDELAAREAANAMLPIDEQVSGSGNDAAEGEGERPGPRGTTRVLSPGS